jgi:hypothetical protein
MGWSIGGCAINKGFHKDGRELGIETEIYWKFLKKVSYDDAFEKHKKKNFFDVCFLENSTLIISNLESAVFGRPIKEGKILSFVIQESTMNFSIDIYNNYKYERGVIVENNEIKMEQGVKSEFESINNDHTEIISNYIKEITSLSLYEFNESMEFYRFKYVGIDKQIEDIYYMLHYKSYLGYKSIFPVLEKYNSENLIVLFDEMHKVISKYNINPFYVDIYSSNPHLEYNSEIGNIHKLMENYSVLIRDFMTKKDNTKEFVNQFYTDQQIPYLFKLSEYLRKDSEIYDKIVNKENKEKVVSFNPIKIEKKWWELWK